MPARRVLLGLAALGAASAGIGLFAVAALLMPGLMLLLWTVTGLIFIDIFAHVPPPPEAAWTVRRQWMRSLWRGLHWLLAAGFVMLSLTALEVSLHLVAVR